LTTQVQFLIVHLRRSPTPVKNIC